MAGIDRAREAIDSTISEVDPTARKWLFRTLGLMAGGLALFATGAGLEAVTHTESGIDDAGVLFMGLGVISGIVTCLIDGSSSES